MDRLDPPATCAAGWDARGRVDGAATPIREGQAVSGPWGRRTARGSASATGRVERSAAAHDGAPPAPGVKTGRGGTGPREWDGNQTHSTKRLQPDRRADRPSVAVRTARGAAPPGHRGRDRERRVTEPAPHTRVPAC